MGGQRLDDVRPGMILAREVRSPVDDRLLLAVGTALTERHMVLLRMWGVVEVDLDGPTLRPDAAPPSTAELQAVAAHVDALFRQTDRTHPVVAELVRLASARRLEAMARARHGDGA